MSCHYNRSYSFAGLQGYLSPANSSLSWPKQQNMVTDSCQPSLRSAFVGGMLGFQGEIYYFHNCVSPEIKTCSNVSVLTSIPVSALLFRKSYSY